VSRARKGAESAGRKAKGAKEPAHGSSGRKRRMPSATTKKEGGKRENTTTTGKNGLQLMKREFEGSEEDNKIAVNKGGAASWEAGE